MAKATLIAYPLNPPSTLRAAGKTLYDQIQGRWKALYAEADGQAGRDELDHYLICKDNTFIVEKGGKAAHDGTFTLDTSQHPPQIALIYKNSFPIYLGGPRPGIAQLEENTLKLCFAPVGQSAPRDFNTYAGSEHVLTIYQRVVNNNPAERIIQTTSAFGHCW